jgi:hypothetical protein
MFNKATWPETTHMILAAFMVTGFLIASVYAVAMLRGRRDRYHRLGMLVPLTFACTVTPIQIVVGDWAARYVADDQPAKLAAMEGLYRSQHGAPESVGGIYYGHALTGRFTSLTVCLFWPGLTRRPTSPAWTVYLPTSAPRSTSSTWPSTAWSASASLCSRSVPGWGGPGGGTATYLPRSGSCVQSQYQVSPPSWPWKRDGSPLKSAASRGSCTACCGSIRP